MKKIYILQFGCLIICNLICSNLDAQTNNVIKASDTCERVVSVIEDPTTVQIAGGTTPTIVSQIPWIRPAESIYRVAFSGTSGSGASHEGVDYINDNQLIKTVYVRAATNGKVVYVREGCEQSSMFAHNTIARESGAGWGNHIVISHQNQIYTRYGHLLKGSILVQNGDSVKMGQIIATMGNSGRSEVRHTHFELGTKTGGFIQCNMSQNFDYVFNPEQLTYSTYNNQLSLTAPTNNKDSVSPNVTLVWENDATATSYIIEIAIDNNFNDIIYTSRVQVNYLKLTGLSERTYYWRVNSNSLNYSQVWSFKVKNLEGFENCLKDGIPANWGRFAENVSKGTISNEIAWVATNIDRHLSGNFSARMGNYMSVSDCWLVTPKLAISASNKTMLYNWSNTAGDYGSSLEVFISENSIQPTLGSAFTKIKTIAEGIDGFWHSENLDLTNFIGKQIFIGFKVHNFGDPLTVSAGGDNWWLDDIVLPVQFINTSVKFVNYLINDFQIYPNPVKDFAVIKFAIKENSRVQIALLDSTGETVENIESNDLLAGVYSYHWNCNKNMPNGFYMIKINTQKDVKLIKIIKIN